MHCRAFTLIELVAVIVIMGVIAAVAIPATSTSTQTRQRSAALLLSRDLGYLQNRALSTGCSTWASFSFTTNSVLYSETISGALTSISDPMKGTQMSTIVGANSEGGWYASVGLGGINGSVLPTTVGFDWQGRPIDSLGTLLTTPQIITVTATGCGNITVTISPETGVTTVSW